MADSDSIYILLDKSESIINAYEINDKYINVFESYNLTNPTQKNIINDTFLNPIFSDSAQRICNDIPIDYIQYIINKGQPYYLLTYIDFENFPPTNHGFLLAYHKSPSEVYIHVICSEKGFGGKLLKYFIRYIKEKVSSVNTISLSALTEVVGFYLRNGFTIRNTCKASPVNVSPENIQQLRKNSTNIKYVGLKNLNAYSGNVTKFKMNRMKTSSDFLYNLYKKGIFADHCDPGMSYEEFLYSRCFGEGVHMVYCISENKVVSSFTGRLPNVPVAIPTNGSALNNENAFGNMKPGNYPPFPQTLKNKLQRDYRRRLNDYRNINSNNENSFGNMIPGNYPPVPQELIKQAERNYRRRWKLGGTRKKVLHSRRTQKNHKK